MTYQKKIAVFPVEKYDRRQIERDENIIITIQEFNKKYPWALFYELTDFMDLCNNQELDLEANWIGYIRMPLTK